MWKTILSAVIALVVAWFAIKIIFWVLGVIGWLVVLALGAAISIPIYLFVRQKLLA